MLVEPSQRLTAEQVLSHIWVAKQAPNSEECLLLLNIDTLKTYSQSNKFKKAVLTFIASRLNDDEIKTLKDIFICLDQNNDGILTYAEIKQGVAKLNSNLNVEEIFINLDTDHSGSINYTEFLAATIDQRIYLKSERLYEAFRSFDKDNSGNISVKEIGTIINAGYEDFRNLEDEVKKFDLNGDGEIDYVEFCKMMEGISMK
jgi:calcium-dependent protein kinase